MKRHELQIVKRFKSTDPAIFGAIKVTEMALQERYAFYDKYNPADPKPNIVTDWTDVPFVDLTI